MTVLAVSGCAGWGAVIWLASSYITGKQEPWDARSLVYPLSLFVAGFIGAALHSSSLLACCCGGVGGPDGRILVERLHFFRCWRIVAFRFGDRLAALFASKSVWSVPWWTGRLADS
jgi:hypothetical protein